MPRRLFQRYLDPVDGRFHLENIRRLELYRYSWNEDLVVRSRSKYLHRSVKVVSGLTM